ncbi:hypothetical protein E2C01_025897 [Portunus trituberculatus]|uniref:Uncharacterized protein n=1 Tax=Portunus trituberculatus TaxID=210409 RepID=A0A5B7EE57_PORTR|nr:hypothetical protein [Portunus trituberculatus]
MGMTGLILYNVTPLIVLSSSPFRSHNDVMAKCLSGYNFEDSRSEISLVSTDHSREIESDQPYNMTCYPNCTIPCVNGVEQYR